MAIAISIANRLILPITCRKDGSGKSKGKGERRKEAPPMFISTNPSHVNIEVLSKLYSLCSFSPNRFPSSEDMDTRKLAVAVANSSVVVSVFATLEETETEAETDRGLWGRLLPTTLPGVTPENGQLVGFGRVVSDLALTASIYDVMVIPSLRRLGIGRMIVQRIVRILINKGIYDISALSSEKERIFFTSCGFGDDVLGSTTMMYANSASNNSEEDRIIIRAGRKLLVSPPSRLPFPSQQQNLLKSFAGGE